jgi:sulfonate transport system ATP-binding protein
MNAAASIARPVRNSDAQLRHTTSVTKTTRGLSISVKGLSKHFGETQVLQDLDLDVPPGQFLAVVGRSGCGKSTLLRILAGLGEPTSGIVCVDGARGQESLAEKSRLMFQEPRLLPWASVLANVEVGLGRDRQRPDSRLRAAEALEAVGLAARARVWPSVLSGGQKQRVALARALVSRPGFLALDEPLGALDALTRIEMQALVERAWLEQGFTAVLVTHDVTEALVLADRVVMIEDGRIALDLPVDLPRPRRRSAPELTRLEERLLSTLIREEKTAPEYII